MSVNYPISIDNEQNLITVKDSLRLRLSSDYTIGSSVIYAEGDITVFNKFPDYGYITLTDQCSDYDEMSVSFYYSVKTKISEVLFSFSGLTLLTNDYEKPKIKTNITQNVMAENHNNLKDAILAIENFIGKKGEIDTQAYGDTMEGRTNFIHSLALQPKAFFSAVNTEGQVPFTVLFENKSFQVGENCPVGDVVYSWNFGDGFCSSVSCESISVVSVVPISAISDIIIETVKGSIEKTYINPGIYDVSLTVKNKWGEDTVVFPGFIKAMVPAPNEAEIEFTPTSEQVLSDGILKTSVNSFVSLKIPTGVAPSSIDIYAPYGRSYAGEVLKSDLTPLDPIINYTWELNDDLSHDNSKETTALYNIGGIYDVVVRADTQNEAYRITELSQTIDVIENINLWLWTFTSGNDVVANEFGLISESFKVKPTTFTVTRNDNFLASQVNANQLVREFNRNVHFTASNDISGLKGDGLIYWSSGRNSYDLATTETINIIKYNGFMDTYSVPYSPTIYRPWNWMAFDLYPSAYFVLGNDSGTPAPNTSPTNQTVTSQNSSDYTLSNNTFTGANYLDGASELTQNTCNYSGGNPLQGHFSTYRTATKNSTGYFLRNNGVGTYFRIQSFYRTEGVLGNPLQNIRKLPDMLGSEKLEGQLMPLNSGLYFFDNSPNLSVYNELTNSWQTGSLSTSSVSYSSLQDRSVSGYNDIANTLVAASDMDRKVYLSFDYSTNSFLKFNEIDLTINVLQSRPEGEQWLIAIY